MNSLVSFLQQQGIDFQDPELHARFTAGKSFNPFVVERISTGLAGHPDIVSGIVEISVCHYGEQNGDAMRDPEICFLLHEKICGVGNSNIGFYPYYYRNDYAGVEDVYIRKTEDGKHLEFAKAGISDLRKFCSTWGRNLRSQNYKRVVTV